MQSKIQTLLSFLDDEDPSLQVELRALTDHLVENRLMWPGTRMVATPPILADHDREQLTTTCRRTLELVLSLPDRLFGGDLRAFGRACGFTDSRLDVILRLAEGPEQLGRVMRCDFYCDDGAWRLLELNLGSNVGGFAIGHFSRALRKAPLLGAAFDVAGVRTAEILEHWAIVAKGLASLAPPGIFALVEDRGALDSMRWVLGILADRLTALGIEAVVCAHDEIAPDGDGLALGSRRVGLVYRLFDEGDVAAARDAYEPIFAAAERGAVLMPLGFQAKLFGSKSVLALLWDSRYADRFTTSERAFIESFIPSTRLVEPSLIDELERDRDSFVLKPIAESSGRGVVCGWEVGVDAWRAVLQTACTPSQRHVVQSRVQRNGGELILLEANAEPTRTYCNFVWGVYLVDRMFAGGNVRVNEQGGPGVINVYGGAGIGPLAFSENSEGVKI
jgi:hypothetical protein